ncbi:hypothetical protein [Clostridium saccharobutylicum]|uniref:Uncharacterized protein n=1 Tax=Clostridium saccharobutylicum TaxID=169679 RepID=A0A1S8MZ44_CLOSA|nr:hypothetical protein [Clostridium saccharobutylicum]OOM09447.1 hypothetical protein CLOSAC_37280 [Clostridium saccharobutylicum]
MKNLEMIEGKKIEAVNGESVIEYVDGKMIIAYLNECNSREVHFIDIFLNEEHLERFDVYNPGLIQDFLFSGILDEIDTSKVVEKLNNKIKCVSRNGKTVEFKVSNQYYMCKNEAVENIKKKISEWTDNKAELNFEKTVVEHIYEGGEYKRTKSIITKMLISYDEIGKEYKEILKILDRAYEYTCNNIPIPIDINEDQISFEDDSQKLYTKYKVSRV